jgi:hypothetical protein
LQRSLQNPLQRLLQNLLQRSLQSRLQRLLQSRLQHSLHFRLPEPHRYPVPERSCFLSNHWSNRAEFRSKYREPHWIRSEWPGRRSHSQPADRAPNSFPRGAGKR